MGILASISIGINPNLFHLGAFTLSWHGVMTFVAVAVAVYLVARWGGKEGMIVDSIYSVAVWAIIGGVIGARFLHVIDFWDEVYKDDFISVFQVYAGGIAIYGAIIGGFIGGALYIMIRNSEWFLTMWRTVFPFMGEAHRANLPGIGRLADIAAPAVLFAQAIGRIGDVINGEHLAKITELPWGIIYTHPDSPAYLNAPVHPAVGYELIFDLVLLAALWPLRDRLRPHGMFFTLYLATYSIGRFFISFLRVEFNQYFGALNEAQVVAIIVVIFTVPLLVWKAQLVRPTTRRT
ncbi:MAG: prolipoprotein diacylglyceryl transferase [Chloroflexi bacterium]|nr:prolipoprotein diacylglyceryl transferase [Chloroflexota bacterium]